MYERIMTDKVFKDFSDYIADCDFNEFIEKIGKHDVSDEDVFRLIDNLDNLLSEFGDALDEPEKELMSKKIELLKGYFVDVVEVSEEEKHIFFSESFEGDLGKLLDEKSVDDIIDCLNNLKNVDGNSNDVEKKVFSRNNKSFKDIIELKPTKGNHQIRIYYLNVSPDVYYVFDIEKKKDNMPKSIKKTITDKAGNIKNSNTYKSIKNSFENNDNLKKEYIAEGDSRYKNIDSLLNIYKKTGKKQFALNVYKNQKLLDFCMILTKDNITINDYYELSDLLENMTTEEIEIIKSISKIISDPFVQKYIEENTNNEQSNVSKVI